MIKVLMEIMSIWIYIKLKVIDMSMKKINKKNQFNNSNFKMIIIKLH